MEKAQAEVQAETFCVTRDDLKCNKMSTRWLRPYYRRKTSDSATTLVIWRPRHQSAHYLTRWIRQRPTDKLTQRHAVAEALVYLLINFLI